MPADRIVIAGHSYLRGRKMRSPVLAFLVARDLLFGWLFKSPKAPALPISGFTEACVCQIDHLGDVLMITPLLVELRRFSPHGKITLVTGRWCEELAEILREGGLVDECVTYTTWPLNPSRRNVLAKIMESFRSLISAARRLRTKPLDIFFDLRPWSPNAWLLARLSRARLVVGYGLRGMADVYNCQPPYVLEKSTGQTHLDALRFITGKNYIFRSPILPTVPKPVHLPLPDSDYLVAQLFSREAARNVSSAVWRNILQKLAQRRPVVLVGAAIDAERAGDLADLPGIISLMGQTSIRDLLGVIQQSRGVVSIDSFAPHVGLAYDKKVAVLMLENTSNWRSFPQNNRNLEFFPATIESAGAVEKFLTP